MTRLLPIFRLFSLAIVALAAVWACDGPAPTVTSVQFAKPGSGDPTVKSTDPDTASQGTTLDVTINGSGFDDGTTAEFGLSGVPSPKITTNSTVFLSPRKLRSNITIADDADVALYDVMVATARGRPGIGTEMFQVKPGNDPNAPALEVTIHDTHATDGATSIQSDGQGPYVDGTCNFSGGYSEPEAGNPLLGFSFSPTGNCTDRSAPVTLVRRHVENASDPNDHSGDFDAPTLSFDLAIMKVRPETLDAEHQAGRGSFKPHDGYCKPNLNHKRQNWPFRFNPHWKGDESDPPLYPYSDLFDVTETDWRDPGTQQDPIAWNVQSKPYPNNVVGCIRGPEIEYWHIVVSWDARALD